MYLPTCYLYSFYYTSGDFGGKLIPGKWWAEGKEESPDDLQGSLRTAKGPCESVTVSRW